MQRAILILCVVLLLLAGCVSSHTSHAASGITSDISKMPDINDCLPTELDVNELYDISIVGLTSDTAISEDLLISSGKNILRNFIKNLDVVKVPISQADYEASAFISGKICIDFSFDDFDYTIISDNSSKIFAICLFQGKDFYIGEFCLDDEYYESMVSLIYDKER